MNKAFFLDRDGVVNVEVDYLSDPGQVVIIPGVPEALKLLKQHGFKTIVVTNQSGVARGMYSEADVLAVHRRIRELLADDGAEIDDFSTACTMRSIPARATAGSPPPACCSKPRRNMRSTVRTP